MTQKTGRTPRYALLDHVPEMVTISDRDGRILYANPATERVSGFAPEEFASLDPFSRMHPEDRLRCEEAFAKLLGNPGLSLHIEHRVRHKDGSWRWVEVTFASLFEDPEVGGLLATVRDATDRKRRELNVALLDEVGKDLSVLSAPDEIIRMVGTRLSEFLQVSGCIFADVDEAKNEATIHHGWNTTDVPSLKQTFRLADYFGEEFARAGRAGETVVVRDTARDERANAEAYARLKLGGFVTVPFQRHGRWKANITVTTREPRDWQADEIELLQEIASRVFPRIERARAEEALRESEEKYRTLVENVGDHAIFMLDAEGRVTEWTRGAERVKGYSAEEVIGRHLSFFCTPEQIEAGEPGRELAEAAETGRAEREDWRVIKGGGRIWVNEIATAVRDAGGALVGFAKIARDLSGRMRAEEALRESEERHRLVVEGARDYAIFTLDPDGRIASWSPGAEAVFGWGADEAVGRTPGFTFTPEDREAGVPEEELASALRDGSAPDVRWHARKDGSRAFIEGRTMVLRRPDGGPRGFLKIGQDVTERRRAEEALRESEERYRLAADAAGIGRWEFAVEAGELAGDATFEKHHGAPPGSGLGFEGHLEAVHPDEHEEIKRRVDGAISGRDGYEVEYRVPQPDGSTRFVLSRGRFVGGLGSVPARLVGVTLDVTGSRELERERERARLRELTALAEAAEREGISRELHDRVAHTMAVAHQALELHSALAESAPERAREKLELARESTKTALDQTRDLSAQLARRGSEETQDGLTSALRELLDTHVPDGVEGDLSAEGDEAAVPPIVKEQAYLVLREAVRNAVAHSGCGRVGVSVEVEGGELRGRVEDDGEGFEPDEIPGGESTDGEDGGPAAGVGLRSMKERTGMLGGRLEVSSKPGRGTAVEVRIPLAD